MSWTDRTEGLLNVRDFGAVGDGQHDDSKAFQSALLAAGDDRLPVFVPGGRFRVAQLVMPPFTSLVGLPSWSFRDMGGARLELADPKASCMIDLSDAFGATINGLCLHGGDLGDGVHGIMVDRKDFGGDGKELTPRIERCRIYGFTGHGLYLNRAWCFSIRHNMIAHNGGDGIWLRGWDGFVLDNWLTGNRGAGFGGYEKNASVSFVSNRVEWNYGHGLHVRYGDHYVVSANYFDRQGGAAIWLEPGAGGPCRNFTVTGNMMYRSGRPDVADALGQDTCEVMLKGVEGLTMTGNTISAGGNHFDETDHTVLNSPDYGIICSNLKNAVICNNSMHGGGVKGLVKDLGGHSNLVIKDNPGDLLDVKQAEGNL